MLDKDSVISASVSEAVEKIRTNEKDYRKCTFMCFTLYSHRIQRTTLYSHRPTYSLRRDNCLPTRIHPV